MKDVIDFDSIDDHGPQSYRATYDANALDLDRPEVANVGNVSIETTVRAGDAADEYEADGTVAFAADLTCSRCADPYPFASNSTFHVRFRPRPEVSEHDEEIEIASEEELDVEFYAERQIPLRDLALEQVQLSIPMKPLCDEACLGLCPTCGANRARADCACGESIRDERWGALKDIREELAKKKNI